MYAIFYISPEEMGGCAKRLSDNSALPTAGFQTDSSKSFPPYEDRSRNFIGIRFI